ncbi:PAS domain-containing sensor histidine kinase, partial [Staphylococcus gallinarum]
MLKFHQRLLFLLCTIVILSFLALGAIISHVVYNTVSNSQNGDLEHQAQHLLSLYNQEKKSEIVNIAKNEKLTVEIKDEDGVLFTTQKGLKINKEIFNEANPST